MPERILFDMRTIKLKFLNQATGNQAITMKKEIKEKIIEVCDKKLKQNGPNVGLSFYAFFENKNNQPDHLFEVAKWWIKTHQLDHFEKATKIKKLALSE